MSKNKREPALESSIPRTKTNSKTAHFHFARSSTTSIFVICIAIGAIPGLCRLAIVTQSDASTSKMTEERTQLQSTREIYLGLRDELDRDLNTIKQTIAQLIRSSNEETPSVVQQMSDFKHALVDAQKRTFESRALVVSLQGALTAGHSLQPFIQQLRVDATTLTSSPTKGSNEKLSAEKRDLNTNETRVSRQANVPSKQRELGSKLLEIAQQRLRNDGAQEDALRQLIDSATRQSMTLDRLMVMLMAIETRWQEKFTENEPNSTFSDISESNPENSTLNETINVPDHFFTVFLGCLIGLMTAFALIFMKRFFRVRMPFLASIQQECGLPLLVEMGKITHLPGTGLDGIITFSDFESDEAKPFRTLRSSLTFSMKTVRRLLVTSAETGDGKTTVIANLAVAFAQAHQKTLLIDVDIRNGGATRMLTLQGSRGLTQIISDDKPVVQSCLENVFNLGIEDFDVMPSGPLSESLSGLLQNNRMKEIVAWAESTYDYVLFDMPAVRSESDVAALQDFVDGAIVVVRPELNRQKDILRTVKSCRTSDIKVIGFVANYDTREIERPQIGHWIHNSDFADGSTNSHEEKKPRMAA